MRWITTGGPEPMVPGWYPTISRWDANSVHVSGAHRWRGSDWICIEPECVTCYYMEAFESAWEARSRARELEAGVGLALAFDLVAHHACDDGGPPVPRQPGLLDRLRRIRIRLGGGIIPLH